MPKLNSKAQSNPTHWPSCRFWVLQLLGLGLSGGLLLWAFQIWPLDTLLIAPYASPSGFVLRDAWATAQLGHLWVKRVLLLIGLGLLVSVVLSYYSSKWRDWRFPAVFVLLSAGLGTGVIGLLKSFSPHACPWHLEAYGGTETHFALFAAGTADTVGGCFPAGHASAGFSLMSLYLVARLAGFRYAYGYWIAAFLLGFLMGWVQMMRGAHFLSHTLWSAWWVWLINLLLFAITCFVYRDRRITVQIPNQMLRLFH